MFSRTRRPVPGPPDVQSPTKILLRATFWLLGAALFFALCIVLGGSHLLIATDPMPSHVDAAVVLQGSIIAERARTDGAVRLLRNRSADRLLISLPRVSYWGQSLPPIALNYIEKNYGGEIAARTDFCETAPEVDSTRQEAQALLPCIKQHKWKDIAVVTSDYHTRRAGFLWRRVARDSGTHVWIDGVADTEFRTEWWSNRRAAKIFVYESSKLMWTLAAER